MIYFFQIMAITCMVMKKLFLMNQISYFQMKTTQDFNFQKGVVPSQKTFITFVLNMGKLMF